MIIMNMMMGWHLSMANFNPVEAGCGYVGIVYVKIMHACSICAESWLC